MNNIRFPLTKRVVFFMPRPRLLIFIVLLFFFHSVNPAYLSSQSPIRCDSILQAGNPIENIKDLKIQIDSIDIITESLPNPENEYLKFYCYSQSSGYDKGMAEMLAKLAFHQYHKSNLEVAKFYAEKALDIAIQKKYIRAMADAHNCLGLINMHQHNWEEAFLHQNKFLKIGEEQRNFAWIGHANVNIGGLYLITRNDEITEHFYKEGINNMLKQQRIDHGLGWAYNSLGKLYNMAKRYDDAIQSYLKALEVWEANNSQSSPGSFVSYNGLAKAYFFKKDIDKSLFYCRKSLDDAAIKNFPEREASALLVKAECLYLKGNIKESLSLFTQTYKIGKQYNIRVILQRATAALAEYYAHENNKEKSAYFYKEAYNLEKEEAEISEKEMLSWLKSEQKNRLLLVETEIQKNKIKLQRLAIFLSAFILILLLALIFYYKKHLDIKIERNQQLDDLNKNISKQMTIITQQSEELQKAHIEIEVQKQKIQDELSEKMLTLAHKSELISLLSLKIKDIQGNESVKREITSFLRSSKENPYWYNLEEQFSRSNKDFFEKMAQKYPNLTHNELLLCSFLKANLNTKDIARLTFKTEPSIKVARSRLRKKLGIENTTMDLTVFLNGL